MKVVLLPINVPSGNCCWDYTTNEICPQFNNEGGHNACTLGFRIKDTSSAGVHTPAECLALKEQA